MSTRATRRAYTLIETLVVIAILGILLALTLAAVQQMRAATLRVQCANNLRQIGFALHQYHDASQAFPPGNQDKGDPYPAMNWEPPLLPYLEQSALWQQAVHAYAQDSVYWDLPPHPFATVERIFACPLDPLAPRVGDYSGLKVAYTSYLGVEGEAQFQRNGVLYWESHVRMTDITDGASKTLMVGERPAPDEKLWFGWWYAGGGQGGAGSAGSVLSAKEWNIQLNWCPPGPYTYGPGRVGNDCDAFHFWSLHPGGSNFLFADGSVRFLPYSAASLLPALASRNGGEAVQLPD